MIKLTRWPGMPGRTLPAALLAITALFIAAPVSADGSRIAGQWIVELEAPPTAVFRGGEVTDRSGGREAVREMAATAPEVTGADRLDVESLAVRDYTAFLDAQREAVLAEAGALLGRSVAPRHVYHHTFNGFAVSMDAASARRLAEIPGVKSVHPDTIHEPANDAGHLWVGADTVWTGAGGIPGGPNRGDGMIAGVIDTGINWDSPYFADSLPGMTPIQNPRPGQVGLCSNPQVQCNNKLIGVYDFTSEGTQGRDPDGHGSHVASSMVGNPVTRVENYGVEVTFETSGVAPRANLISYKVCYDQHPTDPELDGRCEGSAIISAINQAATNQVDVVNYSIGGNPSSPWNDDIARNFRNLRAAGVVPVTSAGNGGPGAATITNPAHAPWMLAVANVTHDRRLVNRLTGLSGGTNAPGELVGDGATAGTGILPIVHAADFGNALCGTGPAELGSTCADNSGASSPFASGTFSGQIVVCDRGIYGRVEKGRNVQLAGAGGMILANTGATGESTNADEHCLPATHVGAQDGDRLRQWLDTGSGHQGRLAGSELALSEDFGGLLNASSSRGPGVPGVMKPNITGPGTNIYGAGKGNALEFRSGTSMASPHVAGTALLLRKAHPGWSVSAVLSALETTADAGRVTEADGSPSNRTGHGAGGVRVDQAVRAGLELPVSTQQFVDANPAAGGNPAQLNLAGFLSTSCESSCTFSRTVRAHVAGTWQASGEGDLSISVQPGSFTLPAGGQQLLQVTVSRGTGEVGEWNDAAVVLTPNSPDLAVQRLPVGVFLSAGSIPSVRDITASRNRGESQMTMHNLVAMDETVFRTSGLVRPDRTTFNLSQDPTPDEPYDQGPGVDWLLVDVPADALLLFAETMASASENVNLYVGRDTNGNGRPDASEAACERTSLLDAESCSIPTPLSGSWWVMVQNRNASGASASDAIAVDVAALLPGNDPSFTAYGPARHDGSVLTIPLFWDQPAMGVHERRVAALGVATSPDHLANVGVTTVKITRGSLNLPQNTVLFNGQPRPMHVPQNNTHDKLYIDVPASADALTVDIAGPVINASLRRRDFTDMDGFEPDTPPAPDDIIVSGVNSGSGLTLAVPGGIVPAGRYYVVLNNPTNSEEMVTVTATYTETARNELVRGLYSPELRSTGQGIEWNGGADDNAYILWYTYDSDGVPVFYITDVEEVASDSSFWRAEILRATTGDGVRQTLTGVGEVGITALDETNLIYSWRYNGRHGSEWLDLVTVNRCAQIEGEELHLLATWTIQGAREGGASVLINDFTEAWIRYYFDSLGVGRWLEHGTVAETPPNSGSPQTAVNVMSVLDYRGFCPYCEDTGFGYEVVGTVEREFFDELSGMETLEFTSRLGQEYSASRTIGRLSQVLGCQ